MFGPLKVAIIVPALNEEGAIASVLDALPGWVDDVIVVDNGSTDRTARMALERGARVIAEPRRGYGSACLAGIAALGRPDVVVFLDAEFSDRPEEMPRLLAPILSGEADLVVGSRVLGRCEPGALTPQQRFGNRLACGLMRIIYGARFTDLGPFRAVHRSALERLRMDDRGYGWTVQMQVRAARMGLAAVEVPVGYRRRIGQSKISGTVRGVLAAGAKILYTILREAFEPDGRRRSKPGGATEQPRRRAAGDISVIIPARNEESEVAAAIRSASGPAGVEVIVVDGCSDDGTASVALGCGARVLRCPPGRARQMNAGAAAAGGEILLFLHADSRLPPGYERHVRRLLSAADTAAAAFALEIVSTSWAMRAYSAAANFRSRALQTPYGDQAIFLARDSFRRSAGFADLPVLEDLELVRRLRGLGRVRVANAVVRTSGRRWQRHGTLRTSLLNQLIILGYHLGMAPGRLHRWRESGIIVPRRALLCVKAHGCSTGWTARRGIEEWRLGEAGR